MMDILIEHCTVCWGYRGRALILAETLRKQFNANVEVVGGTLGQFDVRVDGKLVSSRGEGLLARIMPPRLPDISDVVAAIERKTSLPQRKALRRQAVPREFGPEDAKRFYDRFGSWQDTQFYERAALKYLLLHSDFKHASAVFEWGCGTGRLAQCLFKGRLANKASYVGIDISTTMIGIARRRLALWSGHATVQQADGTAELPYADYAFDRFVATYVLDLLPPPAINHMLTEAHRMLRSNGKLCLVSSTEGVTAISRTVTSIWNYVHTLNPRLVGGCRPLRVSTLLDDTVWRIEHAHVVCSWRICSEIVIACRT